MNEKIAKRPTHIIWQVSAKATRHDGYVSAPPGRTKTGKACHCASTPIRWLGAQSSASSSRKTTRKSLTDDAAREALTPPF